MKVFYTRSKALKAFDDATAQGQTRWLIWNREDRRFELIDYKTLYHYENEHHLLFDYLCHP